MIRNKAIYFIYAAVFLSILLVDTVFCLDREPDTSATMRNNVEAQLKNIRLQNLMETISYLSSLHDRITNKNVWDAAHFIENRFGQYGLTTVVQTYEHKDEIWPNVIAEINGISANNQYILILAHIDSITRSAGTPAPGADDDASGIAALLETARMLKAAGVHSNIYFIAFSNEETGLQGSKYYVQQLKPDMNIIGVINLDVLGYNKPDELFYADALTCQSNIKYKLKAAYLMIKNDLLGWWYGRDVVKIEGKQANKNLVFKIDSLLRSYTDIKTKTMVGEHCG